MASGVPYAELVTERPVERFLSRLLLRRSRLRGLHIASPFISAMRDCRFSLADLRRRVETEGIPTYLITREPAGDYQEEAMNVVLGSPFIEIRYNHALHAKLYLASAERESESFALFGSGNLTAQSIEANVELAMMVYNRGAGRDILHRLHYWASVRLRTLPGSRLVQAIRPRRR